MWNTSHCGTRAALLPLDQTIVWEFREELKWRDAGPLYQGRMAGLCRSVPGAVASWGGSSDGSSGRLFATGARREVSSASSGVVICI
jgi:hypothetical protein